MQLTNNNEDIHNVYNGSACDAIIFPIKKSFLDWNSLKKHRHVSIFSFISNATEKMTYAQILDHLRKNNLLDNFQSIIYFYTQSAYDANQANCIAFRLQDLLSCGGLYNNREDDDNGFDDPSSLRQELILLSLISPIRSNLKENQRRLHCLSEYNL